MANHDIPMILCIHAEYGDVWSVAGEARREAAKERGDTEVVEAKILDIADRWTKRRFMRAANLATGSHADPRPMLNKAMASVYTAGYPKRAVE